MNGEVDVWPEQFSGLAKKHRILAVKYVNPFWQPIFFAYL